MDIEWAVRDADGTLTEFREDVHKAIEFNMGIEGGELLWRYRTKYRLASEELPDFPANFTKQETPKEKAAHGKRSR